MTDPTFSFGQEEDARIRQMSEDWVKGRYYESLLESCSLLLKVKDDRQSQLNRIAVEFIRETSSSMSKKDQVGADKKAPVCSFCGAGPPEVKLGAGPSVFICNECVDVFHKLL